MQIAGMPADQREAGYAICEKSLREAAREMGLSDARMDGFIKLQMKAIRGMVQNMDAGGASQGGTA
jgi:hypothetical protein